MVEEVCKSSEQTVKTRVFIECQPKNKEVGVSLASLFRKLSTLPERVMRIPAGDTMQYLLLVPTGSQHTLKPRRATPSSKPSLSQNLPAESLDPRRRLRYASIRS